jgi:putative pyruvate formate lyase activating enzyme
VVYNSGGYESVETLRSLEGLVDIYLPDFKYMDADLARDYSHASDYPEVAQAALREMRRQVGGSLKVDEDGRAYRGLIVRHLVLPGHVDNSLQCLDWLADFMPFGLHLSLMAQYFPPRPGLPAPLNRCITMEEYAAVVAHAEELDLTDCWIQELEAPDFNNENPFESV